MLRENYWFNNFIVYCFIVLGNDGKKNRLIFFEKLKCCLLNNLFVVYLLR